MIQAVDATHTRLGQLDHGQFQVQIGSNLSDFNVDRECAAGGHIHHKDICVVTVFNIPGSDRRSQPGRTGKIVTMIVSTQTELALQVRDLVVPGCINAAFLPDKATAPGDSTVRNVHGSLSPDRAFRAVDGTHDRIPVDVTRAVFAISEFPAPWQH